MTPEDDATWVQVRQPEHEAEWVKERAASMVTAINNVMTRIAEQESGDSCRIGYADIHGARHQCAREYMHRGAHILKTHDEIGEVASNTDHIVGGV